ARGRSLALRDRAEQVIVMLRDAAASDRHDATAADQKPSDDAAVELPRLKVLRMRSPVWCGCAWHRAAAPILVERAERHEDRTSSTVVPREPRPHLAAFEHRHVGPAVMIEIRSLLEVAAAEHADVPLLVDRLREPRGGVRAAVRRLVE